MDAHTFFSRYARDPALEFFRGEDLPAGVPARPGLYAWYGRVQLTAPERATATTAEGLQALLQSAVFERFRRQPYEVTLSAALEPEFSGTVKHQAVRSPALRDAAETWSPEGIGALTAALFGFFGRSFVPGFSSPLYIGKAVRQPLAKRIAQHLEHLHSYLGPHPGVLEQRRREILETEEADEERAAHSFALEAAVRRFTPDRMLLMTWSPSVDDPRLFDVLEALVNRTASPACGRG
jgi:hypothetical protein